MHDLIRRLFPICRSITGDGVRETLSILDEYLPLEVHEVPTGTQVFDWTVPKEWNIRDAWVADESGRRLIDFRESNLHVVGYSVPMHATLTRKELEPHLFSLPDRADLVPWRTSFYAENWGFCLRDIDRNLLGDGPFDVCIEAKLTNGHLTYGEVVLPGRTDREILLTAHICHPSLANDNLSGIALATFLGRHLADADRHHTVRILFIPGTIGSITWLARNEGHVERIDHGIVLAGVGDRGPLTYKRSRQGNADVDRAMANVLQTSGRTGNLVDFSPYGYDERQFCSPGFNLAVGRLSRTLHGTYPEYHTSGDNLDFVDQAALGESFGAVSDVIAVLEGDGRYRNLNPKCEPQLGKRGLYRAIGAQSLSGGLEMAMLWTLNLSDGSNRLLDIAERAGLPFQEIRLAADTLLAHDLLEAVPPTSVSPS